MSTTPIGDGKGTYGGCLIALGLTAGALLVALTVVAVVVIGVQAALR